MKSEFSLAINEITERFGLSQETVLEALEAAMVSAYRRSVNASSAQNVAASFDFATGRVRILAEKEVVEEVQNPQTEVSLEEARAVAPEAQIGDMVMVDSTPADFGRVAAQTAKQVILQRLREAERDAQYEEFAEREGDMVHGTVHSITPQAVTVGLGRAEAILPRTQQIPGERFRVRDRIRVYVLEVRKSSRGPVIVVSRTHPNMLRRLLEMEVPEINQGLVEIKAIAREAGKRAKVAVAGLRDGVDPVGACVGLRGVRIQSIVRDLNDEKIDVIEWNPTPATFIAKALSPARVSGVYLEEDPDRGRTAMVVVPEDQLSLAIGRAGVNARLAARLTGWRIDIKSLPEAASESLHLLQANPAFADLAEQEGETLPKVEAILAKKAEDRPVSPEEYHLLRDFVDRVQREAHERRQAVHREKMQRLADIRAEIPPTAYETPLEALDFPARILGILSEAGYETAGQLMEQLGVDEDALLALSGVGPKTMETIRKKLEEFVFPEPVVEEAAVPEEAEAALEPTEAEGVAEEAEAALEVEAGEEAAEAVEAPAEAEAVEVAESAVEVAEAGEEAETVFEEEAVAEAFEEEPEPEPEPELVLDEDKKRKKRKKVTRVVEFDPDLGELVVKRRRKRAQPDGWVDVDGLDDLEF